MPDSETSPDRRPPAAPTTGQAFAPAGTPAKAPPSAPPTARGTVPGVVRAPRWALVIGSLCVILAAVDTIWGLVTVAVPVLSDWTQSFRSTPLGFGSFNAMAQHARWTAGLGAVTLLAAGLLLAGGVGLMGARRWSRPTLLAWSVLKVALAFATLALDLIVNRQTQADMAAASFPVPAYSQTINFLIYGAATTIRAGMGLFVLLYLLRPRIARQIHAWP